MGESDGRTNFQRAARTPTAPIGVPSKTSTQPSGTAWSTNIGERPDAAPNASRKWARPRRPGSHTTNSGAPAPQVLAAGGLLDAHAELMPPRGLTRSQLLASAEAMLPLYDACGELLSSMLARILGWRLQLLRDAFVAAGACEAHLTPGAALGPESVVDWRSPELDAARPASPLLLRQLSRAAPPSPLAPRT